MNLKRRRLRNLITKNIMVYLVVKDNEYKGVYEFISRGVADTISKNFSQAVIMEEHEKERALTLVNVSEVTDAIFLIRKFGNKPSNSKKEKAPVEEEKTIKTKDTKDNNTFTQIMNKMKELNVNALKVTMFSGDEYNIALKSQFYINEPNLKNKLLYIENGEVVLNKPFIDELISKGTIGIVPKSKFEVIDDFAVITNCDSKYSPNTRFDEDNKISYEREYEKIVINTKQIESICKADKVTFGDYEIHQEVIIKYLVKKML